MRRFIATGPCWPFVLPIVVISLLRGARSNNRYDSLNVRETRGRRNLFVARWFVHDKIQTGNKRGDDKSLLCPLLVTSSGLSLCMCFVLCPCFIARLPYRYIESSTFSKTRGITNDSSYSFATASFSQFESLFFSLSCTKAEDWVAKVHLLLRLCESKVIFTWLTYVTMVVNTALHRWMIFLIFFPSQISYLFFCKILSETPSSSTFLAEDHHGRLKVLFSRIRVPSSSEFLRLITAAGSFTVTIVIVNQGRKFSRLLSSGSISGSCN